MNKFCITKSFSVLETIEFISNNNERAVFVCDDCNKIIGVVSQGDIIRALISGISVYHNIKDIMNINFLYIKEYNLQIAYNLFKTKNITILPVINDNYEILNIITINDIYNFLEEKCL
ncbi:MAG: CBS domain-containing protein [Lachnospiraceae bacterium]|nr:CBS domain-containing protein [Lachnospiraceae bacterium]